MEERSSAGSSRDGSDSGSDSIVLEEEEQEDGGKPRTPRVSVPLPPSLPPHDTAAGRNSSASEAKDHEDQRLAVRAARSKSFTGTISALRRQINRFKPDGSLKNAILELKHSIKSTLGVIHNVTQHLA